MTVDSPWLSLAEAAAYAKFHKSTLADALRDGSLRGYQVRPGGDWRIRASDLDAWISGERVPATPITAVTRKRAAP
jgi:excisionase family DNA binding protein